jgi:protein phosphatase PTC1
MEDAHVTVDQYNGHKRQGYFAVYDGHGGRGVVEFIEKVLHVNLQIELEESKTSKRSVEECMKSAFLITDIQSKEQNLLLSGSTAVVCYIEVLDDDTRVLHTANCGDARAVLARGGKAIRLTCDHKATDPEEQKRIEDEMGFVMRGRVLGILAVSRSFGDHSLKQFVPALPFYRNDRMVQEDKFLIIACDGVWDVMTDQEAVDFVNEKIDQALNCDDEGKSSNESPFATFQETVARQLVDEALARNSTDNVTVQIVLLDE